jgi:hypothetical protein
MCAARRTYGLDSTDLASMKVVLAGKAFLFGLIYFFYCFGFGERVRSISQVFQLRFHLLQRYVSCVKSLPMKYAIAALDTVVNKLVAASRVV